MSRRSELQSAFSSPPERYLGAEPGFDATYHVRIGDIGCTWEVRCSTHGARVRAGVAPAGFRHHVEEWLPSAEQIVLDGCGHVPQVERPERTNGLLERFLGRVNALGAPAGEPRAA